MSETAHHRPLTLGTTLKFVLVMFPVSVFLWTVWTVGVEGETLDRARLWSKLGMFGGSAGITGVILHWWSRRRAPGRQSARRAR